MRKRMAILAAAWLASVAAAQVSVTPGVIRSGDTVIDANGIHTPTATIGGGAIRKRGGDMVIRTNGNRRRIACGGGALSVAGNGNLLDVEGCRRLTLEGNGNIVNAHFPMPGRVAVLGNHNRLSWSAAPGARVGVSNLGTGNTVSGR